MFVHNKCKTFSIEWKKWNVMQWNILCCVWNHYWYPRIPLIVPYIAQQHCRFGTAMQNSHFIYWQYVKILPFCIYFISSALLKPFYFYLISLNNHNLFCNIYVCFIIHCCMLQICVHFTFPMYFFSYLLLLKGSNY